MNSILRINIKILLVFTILFFRVESSHAFLSKIRDAIKRALEELEICVNNPCSCLQPSFDAPFLPDENSMIKLRAMVDNKNEQISNRNISNDEDNPLIDVQTISPASFGYDYKYNRRAVIGKAEGAYPINTLCAPYGKKSGHVGCLNQFSLPWLFLMPFGYDKYCIESTDIRSELSSFVRVRKQSCNPFVCWTNSDVLDAVKAQCKTYGSGFGLPLIRLCSRFAMKTRYMQFNDDGSIKRDSNSKVMYFYTKDHGYQDHMIDKNGFPLFDPGYDVIDQSGGISKIYLPKVCVYNDPSILTIASWITSAIILGFLALPILILFVINNITYFIEFVDGMINSVTSNEGSAVTSAFNVLNSIFDRFDFREGSQPIHRYGNEQEKRRIMMQYNYIKDNMGSFGLPVALENIFDFFNQMSSFISGSARINFQVWENQHFNMSMPGIHTGLYYHSNFRSLIPTEPHPSLNLSVSPTQWGNRIKNFAIGLRNFYVSFFTKCDGARPDLVNDFSVENYKKWLSFDILCRKESIGCVKADVGIFPPPYCQNMWTLKPGLRAEKICEQLVVFNHESISDSSKPKYIFRQEDSSYINPCVKSNVRNNFIYNSFRISSTLNIPVCIEDNDETDSTLNGNDVPSDNNFTILNQNPLQEEEFRSQCVKLHGSPILQLIYDNDNGLLRLCNSSKTNLPCFEMIGSSANNLSSSKKYMMQFIIRFGPSNSRPLNGAFPRDLNVCQRGVTVYPCIEFSGMNVGDFVDVSFNLSNTAGNAISYSSGQLTQDFSIQVAEHGTYNGTAIIKFENSNSNNNVIGMYAQFTRPGSTYVLESNVVERAKNPPYIFRGCNNGGNDTTGLSCQPLSTRLNGIGVIGFTAVSGAPSNTINDNIALKIYPRLLSNDRPEGETNSSTYTINYFNFAGALVDSFVSDNNFTVAPFNDHRFSDPEDVSSRFGRYFYYGNNNNKFTKGQEVKLSDVYKYTESLQDDNLGNDIKSKTHYAGGLEYEYGAYLRGGSIFSSAILDRGSCPFTEIRFDSSNVPITYKNYSNCVLAKLNYSDLIDCGDFRSNDANNPKRPCLQGEVQSINSDDPHRCIAGRKRFQYNGQDKFIETAICNPISSEKRVIHSMNQSNITNMISRSELDICYYTTGNNFLVKSVCEVSNNPFDRVIPAPAVQGNVGTISLSSDQFYNEEQEYSDLGVCASSSDNKMINESKCAVRSKTIFELGGNIAIESNHRCFANANADQTNGFATWPETQFGNIATGTCKRLYRNKNATTPPTRVCVSEGLPLSSGISPKFTEVLNPCERIFCPAITQASSATGQATFPQVFAEESAVGTCATDYEGTPSARCSENGEWAFLSSCNIMQCSIYDHPKAILNPIRIGANASVSCKTGFTGTLSATCSSSRTWVNINDGCLPVVCNAITQGGNWSGYATFSSTTYGNIVSGSCISNEYKGSAKAQCTASGDFLITERCVRKSDAELTLERAAELARRAAEEAKRIADRVRRWIRI